MGFEGIMSVGMYFSVGHNAMVGENFVRRAVD